MPVAALAHHAVLVGVVGAGDGQVGVGGDGDGDVLVGDLLADGVQRVGGDAEDSGDAQRLVLVEVGLDVGELVPAGLAAEAFLEVQQGGLPRGRGEVKDLAIGGLELDGRGGGAGAGSPIWYA